MNVSNDKTNRETAQYHFCFYTYSTDAGKQIHQQNKNGDSTHGIESMCRKIILNNRITHLSQQMHCMVLSLSSPILHHSIHLIKFLKILKKFKSCWIFIVHLILYCDFAFNLERYTIYKQTRRKINDILFVLSCAALSNAALIFVVYICN